MKSDFDARPIYLNKREHIRAHFLLCFVSLVILRLIQNGMAHAGCLWKGSQKRYGEQTVFWKEAVMYVCWMWGERSGMRRDWIKKAGRWCRV